MTLNAVLDDSGTKELNLGTHKELNLSASTGKWTGHRTLQVLFIRYMAGNKATD